MLHTLFADVPAGDILCHTGDVFLRSSQCRCCCRDADNFAQFLRAQPHAAKVVIGGNHDREFEEMGHDTIQTELGPTGHYLLHSSAQVAGLSFFGTPVSPPSQSPNKAFRQASVSACLSECPVHVDVLLSHASISDTELVRLKPRLHAFGHFHSDYGIEIRHGVVCVNAAICDAWYRALRSPVVIDMET